MSEAKDDQPSQASAKIPTKLPDPNQNPKRFSEFDLQGKVFIVTGGVYYLDRLTEPDEEFNIVAARLAASFQGSLRYGHMDVRDTNQLESIVESIASEHSRLDGVIAAASV
nr:hypothetical protein LTR18_002338 [Exophiala xenobiotica]